MYERIRDLRKDIGMTQEALAEKIGVKQRTYSDYERGRTDFSTAALCNLASFYNTSADYLLNRTDQYAPRIDTVPELQGHRSGAPFYPRIRELRKKTKQSQTVFAENINFSQTGYSHYEIGDRDIPTVILIRLADIHDTSVDYILGRTGDPEPFPKSLR